MPEIFDLILHNVQLVSMAAREDYGILDNAVVAIKDQTIQAIYQADSNDATELHTEQAIDGKGMLLTPGLIDCHTHLVYAGNRANEFEMRLNGASYEAIAKAGGGIISTVKATRDATQDELFDLAAKRLSYWIDQGVTSIEIKSGYGLDLKTEQKMLQVAEQLNQYSGIEVYKTFLGAHALAPEYQDRADDYIEHICTQMMPKLNDLNLIDSVDAFCETIGFTPEQTERVFKAAKQLGLPIKLHAEQLSDQKGAKLASQYHALSVDHLEYLDPQDIPNLKKNNTVATLLPAAYYFLSETKLPPIEALRKNQVPIAIASDSNPGSAPGMSLLLCLNMACTLFKMTPLESLQGVTINAAKALGIDKKVGSIEVGKQADLALWDLKSPTELSYWFGVNPCQMVIKNGKVIVDKTGIE